MSLALSEVQEYISDERNKNAIKALVVDDSSMDQMILKKILLSNHYEVRSAYTGHSAIKLFREYEPDVVFMNLNLPDISSQELTRNIKALSQDQFVPVIYVTSTSDDQILSKCLDSGGDDFVNKPVNTSLLNSKTKSLLRIKKMHDSLLNEKWDLLRHGDKQLKDLHDADSVIHNLHTARYYDSGNMDWFFSAKNILSGDVLCSAIDPNGKQFILVGDNTGHGIPAVTGSIITLDTFHSMVSKGFDIEIIIEEINKKFYYLLPTDRFLAASILEFDEDYHTLKVWNAGSPDILICDNNGDLKEKLPSMHLPLGISLINEKDIIPVRVNLEEGDCIYVYTDGLIETFNETGEMYGIQRLIETIKSSRGQEKKVDAIISDTKKFRNNNVLTDDTLLLEITCDKSNIKNIDRDSINSNNIQPMDWSMNYELSTDVIRQSNPVPSLVQAIVDIQGFGDDRGKIFLILTELYSNALEHGILGLESSIKETENGFLNYYELRQSRLDKLKDAHIKIDVKHRAEGTDKGVVFITLEHNGESFNYNKVIARMALKKTNTVNNGRGIALLYDLCRRCKYTEDGRKIEVEIEWQFESDENVA